MRVALVDALGAAYPAVLGLVGSEFFERMALVYASDRPATERTLNLYGGEFADFIVGFAPARELPYLADVARLERAVLEARHAADASALDPTALTALGAGLSAARLKPHPATRLVRSEYPIRRNLARQYRRYAATGRTCLHRRSWLARSCFGPRSPFRSRA